MPISGTENAAIIWRLVESNLEPMTEAEVKEATGLGTGTINRLMRTMVAQGFMARIPPSRDDVTRYKALRTIHEVRTAFCRRVVELPPKRASDVLSHFRDDMPRVSCVWELGAALCGAAP